MTCHRGSTTLIKSAFKEKVKMHQTSVNHVIKYAEAEFRTFPILPKSKKPAIKKWHTIKFIPPEKLAAKFITIYSTHNFGIALDDTHLIIDIDPRNGGEASLEKLNKDLGIDIETACTVTVLSGRGDGGRHLYFKKPAKFYTKKNPKDESGKPAYPGIDFLTTRTGVGQYMLGAGSIHPDTGEPYKFSIDSMSLKDITDLPNSVRSMLKKLSGNILESKTKDKDLKEYVDTDQNIKKATAQITTYPPAIEGESGDEQTYKAAAICKDHGLSPEATYDLLAEHYNPRCEPPWQPEELKIKIGHAYRYGVLAKGHKTAEAAFQHLENAPVPKLSAEAAKAQADELADYTNHMVCTSDGFPKHNNYKNTRLYLTYHENLLNLFAYNQFTQVTCMRFPPPWAKDEEIKIFPRDGKPMEDVDDLHLRSFLNAIGYDASKQLIHDAVECVAHCNAYHPVKDYFNTLKWDGKHRLDSWLTNYFGVAKNSYTQVVGRKTLLAAVARTFEPGTKFDHVLIIEGEQGKGKSIGLSFLANGWFSDSYLQVTNKDAVDQIQGVLLYELGEMACTTKSETETLKAFISRPVDRVRLAYARRTMSFPRQCVFIGTSNRDDYLKDETGNRRYWPVESVGKIDLEAIQEHRDQIWAEAVYQWLNKREPLYLTDEKIIKLAKEEQEHRRSKDEWEEMIIDWLDVGGTPDDPSDPIDRITGVGLWEGCLMKTKYEFDRKYQLRLGNIMRALGWIHKPARDDNGSLRKMYVRPE